MLMENWNARLYNEKYNFVYAFGESLIDLLDPQPDERILDVGCGSAQLTAQIAVKAQEVVGLDASAEMIEDAKQRYPQIDFHVMDASSFKFDKPFDKIFSNAALHWVLDAKGAVRCMADHLKQNGKLVLEMGAKGNVQSIVAALREVLTARGFLAQAKFQQWYFPSVGEYTSLLEKHGFEVNMALCFDRPTPLADKATGIKDWLTMFGAAFLTGVPENEKEAIRAEVQKMLEPTLLKGDTWLADYKRLRIMATKK
ncbi:MAG: SAM-dependent methyltransferase [Cytophagaceae bacterium]|nr:SAM-dependent methyltransferase [Cytophagaceae bacterium]